MIKYKDKCLTYSSGEYRYKFVDVDADDVDYTVEELRFIAVVRGYGNYRNDLTCYPEGSIYCGNFNHEFIEVIQPSNPVYTNTLKEVLKKI